MKIAFPAPAGMVPWLAERAGIVVGPNFLAMAAVTGDGRIAGMVGWDGATPGAVCLHIALESPAALRALLGPGFDVTFNRLRRPVAIATVVSSNERSLRLVRRLGFREVHRGKGWWAPGVDLVFHEMRRDECRWLNAAREAA